MFKGITLLSILAVTLLLSPFFNIEARAENILELEQAYELVLTQNPQVQSYRAKIMAAEGNRIQQSLMPNPEAVFEVENFGGSSARDGFDAAEYTLGIEQQIEIAGKRSKRQQVASLEKQQLNQEALVGIQSLLAQTKLAYVRIAITQERLSVASNRVKRANKTHSTVKGRINVAKSADIQHTKADIEISSAEVAKRKAQNSLDLAKVSLSNLIGSNNSDYKIVFNMDTLPDIPERDFIIQALRKAPMSLMGELSVMREASSLDLAKANRLPDPRLGLGVRRFNEDDGTAFLASVSMPIAIFDRNQGGVAEAKANLLAAQADKETLRLNITKQALELWRGLMTSKEEVLAYQNGLLPSAKKAYRQAEYGFNRGAFSFLDLLDAQRTLFDVQEGHLEALNAFYETKTQLDLLTGEYTQITNSAYGSKSIEKE